MVGTPVRFRTVDGVVVAAVAGDIDIANRDTITTSILARVSNEAAGLCLDLAAVRYLDSAGVSMLFDLARRLDTARLRMGVALDEDSPLRTLLKITNVHEVLTVCASVDECVAAATADP